MPLTVPVLRVMEAWRGQRTEGPLILRARKPNVRAGGPWSGGSREPPVFRSAHQPALVTTRRHHERSRRRRPAPRGTISPATLILAPPALRPRPRQPRPPRRPLPHRVRRWRESKCPTRQRAVRERPLRPLGRARGVRAADVDPCKQSVHETSSMREDGGDPFSAESPPLLPQPAGRSPSVSSVQVDLVRQHFERMWNERDFAACTDLMAESFVEHGAAPLHAAPGRFTARPPCERRWSGSSRSSQTSGSTLRRWSPRRPRRRAGPSNWFESAAVKWVPPCKR